MATSPTCHASQQPRLLAVGLPRSPTGQGRRSCRAEKKLLSSTSDSDDEVTSGYVIGNRSNCGVENWRPLLDRERNS
ncbi:hypothetical protein JZ751_011552 [Albula glossodonta]|uniref:Uncharacterized protein n=1 Tax=Albula glossodonta TaxID=121402 RepID=A0A8T2MW36_9TELE|nr:hypothetical protein JZ751_011552 [Albula glossodonta]